MKSGNKKKHAWEPCFAKNREIKYKIPVWIFQKSQKIEKKEDFLKGRLKNAILYVIYIKSKLEN